MKNLFGVLKKTITESMWLLLCIFSILLALYSFRSAYIQRYDATYAQDLYDHSQWVMPISIRSIGDELLYQLAGYKAVTTGKLFDINPETPPLGKYLYGLSIVLTKNAYVVTIPLFVMTVFLVYALAKLITEKKIHAQITTVLFCISPLAVSQMHYTMLDLPQLLALLAHVYALFIFAKNKKSIWIVLSGIFLGSFIGTKIGFFAVAVLLADILFLYKKKLLLSTVLLLFFTIITYVSVFLPYIAHEGLLQWFRSEKWVLHFYMSSTAHSFPGLVFFSLFAGITKGWNSNDTWRLVEYFTLLWPIMGVIFLIKVKGLFVGKMNKVTDEYFYGIVLSGLLIISFLFVPFFPRYLLLALPFLIIYASSFVQKLPKKCALLFFSILYIQYFAFIFPQPTYMINGAQKLLELGAYQDLYSHIDSQTRQNNSRTAFWRTGKVLDYNIRLISRNIAIQKPSLVLPWENATTIGITITYTTPLGIITSNIPITLIREQNVWKIVWSNNLYFPLFDSYSDIRTVVLPSTFSRVITHNTIISEGVKKPVIYVIPKLISDEEVMQNQLFYLTGLKKHDVEAKYKANNLPDKSVLIGSVLGGDRQKEILTSKLDPAIQMRMQLQRVFYPSRVKDTIYTKSISTLRKNNEILYPIDGGYIQLTSKAEGSKKRLLYVPQMIGHDIIL